MNDREINASSVERKALQTVQAMLIPESLLKIKTVVDVTGLSESSIRRRMAEGRFPAPVKDGARCTRWVAGNVTEWLKARAGQTAPSTTENQQIVRAKPRLEIV